MKILRYVNIKHITPTAQSRYSFMNINNSQRSNLEGKSVVNLKSDTATIAKLHEKQFEHISLLHLIFTATSSYHFNSSKAILHNKHKIARMFRLGSDFSNYGTRYGFCGNFELNLIHVLDNLRSYYSLALYSKRFNL